jgi:hypothetical protein
MGNIPEEEGGKGYTFSGEKDNFIYSSSAGGPSSSYSPSSSTLTRSVKHYVQGQCVERLTLHPDTADTRQQDLACWILLP